MPEGLHPLPFEEAIAWAKSRGVVLPDIFYGKLQGFARAQAFSIAGIARLDQLTAAHTALTKALEEGSTLADWKKGVAKGEIPIPGLPAHRLENIFRTNLQSAYGRGRCEQQRSNIDTRPWLMYDAVNDSRARPSHAAMDGFVARHDDPIWKTWRPPCGYQCRCRLIALTERQVEQYQKADQRRLQSTPGLVEVRMQAITGGPDAGWDYDICENPGAGVEAAVKAREGNPLGIEVDAEKESNQLAATISQRLFDDVQPPRKIGQDLTDYIFGKEKKKTEDVGVILSRVRADLAATAKKTGKERGYVFDMDSGRLIGVVDGTKGSVPFTGLLADRIRDYTSNVLILHSHPGAGAPSLSLGDFTIGKQIEAVTTDGSVFFGKRKGTGLMRAHKIAVNRASEVLPEFGAFEGKRLSSKGALIGRFTKAESQSVFWHVVNSALEDAGIVDYRATPSQALKDLWDREAPAMQAAADAIRKSFIERGVIHVAD